MPDLIPPLRNKGDAVFVANTAFTLCAVFYIMLAVLGALAFDRVDALVSLNWADYTGCGTGWEPCMHKSALSRTMAKLMGAFIQILVLCFPVVNVTSSYPLACVTVGDNMYTLIPSRVRHALGLGPVGLKQLCRAGAALGPLLVAATFMPLSLIFTIAGLFGFIVSLTIPSWLQLVSMDYCEKKYGPQYVATPYSTPLISGKPFTLAYFSLSIVCVLASLYTMR